MGPVVLTSESILVRGVGLERDDVMPWEMRISDGWDCWEDDEDESEEFI
jgi:hypothetical protein